MNFAFELKKDKAMCEDNLIQAHRVVSLWDVLRIKANDFTEIWRLLGWLHGCLAIFPIEFPGKKSIANIPHITEQARRLHELSAKMGLRVLEDRSRDLHVYLARNVMWDIAEVKRMLTALPGKMSAELKAEIWYRIRPDYKKFCDGKEAFLSRRTLKNFPDIKAEERKARRCYALEEYTAAAFHLMRIMELLVQRFASKLPNVTFNPDEDSWGNLLGRCRDEMKKWEKGHPSHKFKKQYNSCCDLLNGVRPERNDLIHHGQDYNENSVKDLKGTVQLTVNAILKLPQLVDIS